MANKKQSKNFRNFNENKEIIPDKNPYWTDFYQSEMGFNTITGQLQSFWEMQS